MRLTHLSIFVFISCINLTSLHTQDYVKINDASQVETYKQIDDVELRVWIYHPKDHSADEPKPAIVFFFGGGWRGGTPSQFVEQCKYLANRGTVAMTADYRVSGRHGVKANSCVADAKSAIRWVRLNADRLGIDPNKIVASGGSAGGHLAASTGTLPGHDETSDYKNVSCIPNAMALFNPALVLHPVEGVIELGGARIESLIERLGADPATMSPYHHINDLTPPTIIFHGTADKTVVFKSAEVFDKKMDGMDIACQLVAYEGEGHGFFNFNRKNNAAFISTMQYLDEFLVDLGYLDAPPNVQVH